MTAIFPQQWENLEITQQDRPTGPVPSADIALGLNPPSWSAPPSPRLLDVFSCVPPSPLRAGFCTNLPTSPARSRKTSTRWDSGASESAFPAWKSWTHETDKLFPFFSRKFNGSHLRFPVALPKPSLICALPTGCTNLVRSSHDDFRPAELSLVSLGAVANQNGHPGIPQSLSSQERRRLSGIEIKEK